jgi:hypothetical protein
MNFEHPFHLKKWYFDCITDAGDVFIGYSALLQWKALTLHYSSRMTGTGSSELDTKTSLSALSEVTLEEDRIHWSCKGLGLEGTWAQLSEPIEKTLYECPEGKIRWMCLQPKSKAAITIGTDTRFEGLGYTEVLDLTVKPWQLPIADLRWGRFLSDQEALVWIGWTGVHPLSLIFHNGKELPECIIADDHITLDTTTSTLVFQERVELRNDSLLSGALSMIPGIQSLFPGNILNTVECKWRSRGVFTQHGAQKSTGWIIHEHVRFP